MLIKTNKKIGFIYTLSDPQTEMVRYVGQAVDVNKRYNLHLYFAKKGVVRTHKEKWIKSLITVGLKPTLDIVWEGEYLQLSDKEMQIIALFKSFGAILTNSTLGGETTIGRKCKEETKEKFRQMFTGKCLRPPITEKEKQATSLRSRGRKLPAHQIDVLKKERNLQSDYWVTHPNAKKNMDMFSQRGKMLSKKIVAVKDGIKTSYQSTKIAAKETGCDRKTMRMVANGVYKQCKGYIFQWA